MLAVFLCACGFHLRGMIDVPTWLEQVSVIAKEEQKELADLLKAQLDSYKIKVIDDPSQAKYWIIINYSTVKQQIISIGASTNPRQYQLLMTTNFSLKARDGQIIKAARNVVVSRQFTSNNDRILGSNEEEAILINEMRQDTVVQIINRLSKQ
ncbi:hypothetical protein ELY15_09075 [Legionella sp. km772]|nr:hypothetical protein ELY15_09075 [Legionella sp. km772]